MHTPAFLPSSQSPTPITPPQPILKSFAIIRRSNSKRGSQNRPKTAESPSPAAAAAAASGDDSEVAAAAAAAEKAAILAEQAELEMEAVVAAQEEGLACSADAVTAATEAAARAKSAEKAAQALKDAKAKAAAARAAYPHPQGAHADSPAAAALAFGASGGADPPVVPRVVPPSIGSDIWNALDKALTAQGVDPDRFQARIAADSRGQPAHTPPVP